MQQWIDELRQQLNLSSGSARRVFHGRGRAFPGYEHLNIEWYPPYLFVQNFGETLGSDDQNNLKQLFDQTPDMAAILVQSRQWPDFVTEVLCERESIELPLQQWTSLGHDIECETSLGKNRNTGVFLDMRAGWEWVRKHSEKRSVLNLFSYTGVFSLFALSGGATRVDNVDMAANVLKIAQRNHQKNGLHDGKAAFYKRNILKSDRWFEGRQPYDLIIIDPPPYQKKAFHGWRDYRKLLQLCRSVLNENGQMFACLNNPQVTIDEFKQDLALTFPDCKAIEVIETAAEIREQDAGKGLKTVALQF